MNTLQEDLKIAEEYRNKRSYFSHTTPEEDQFIRNSELRFSAEFDIENLPDTFVEEYPDPKVRDIHSAYYFDNSPRITKAYDREISSFYTQRGILQLDEWFSTQIRSKSYDYELMTKMIRRNPHLHNIIKTNLLNNLNSIVSENVKGNI